VTDDRATGPGSLARDLHASPGAAPRVFRATAEELAALRAFARRTENEVLESLGLPADISTEDLMKRLGS